MTVSVSLLWSSFRWYGLCSVISEQAKLVPDSDALSYSLHSHQMNPTLAALWRPHLHRLYHTRLVY